MTGIISIFACIQIKCVCSTPNNNVTEPAKAGHICTNYTCLENTTFHGHR